MKNTNIFFSLIAMIILFASCTKKDTYYTVKGQILIDCKGSRLANKELTLNHASGGEALSTARTDANGYFTFTYKDADCSGGDDLTISYLSPILQDIPTNKNVEIGTIYFNPSDSIVYRLKVNNAHAVNDSMYCFNFGDPSSDILLIGPFQDTTFGSYNISQFIRSSYNTSSRSTIESNWFIRNGTFYSGLKKVEMQIQYCNLVPDTLTMVID